MERSEKNSTVETLGELFNSAPHMVVASFSGLSVNQANELRTKVRAAGGSYRVIKNRLARLAAAGTPAEELSAAFAGPCAVAAHDSDPVALAKALADFAKANPAIELQAGLLDAKSTLDAAGVKRLSAMPSLEQLRAQLLALIQTPATTLVRLIGTPSTQLARVIDARREALGGES
ncbi:MAG: 50S ribosomal protein L10 [bacterium]|nr:50S ribosomal protein L10 [bacterium]